jgi:hypothetical protein
MRRRNATEADEWSRAWQLSRLTIEMLCARIMKKESIETNLTSS